MFEILKRTIRILGINLKEVLLFEILYRIVSSTILFSLFTRGISLAIKYSGYSYLTTKNLGIFLIKPVTLLVLFVVFCVGLLFVVLESSSLLAAFQAGERCERLTVYRIFGRGLGRCRFYLNKKNFYIAAVNSLMLLVFNYIIFLRGIAHVRLLGEMLEGINMSMRWSGFFVLLAVAIVFLFLPGLFTVHFGLLNRKEGKEAWHESRKMVSGHAFGIVFSMLCLNIVLYLVFRLVLFALTFLAALVIYLFVSRTITLALFLTTYDWLEIVALGAAGITNVVCNLALLTGLYYTCRDEAGMAPELLVPEEEQSVGGSKTTRAALIAVSVFVFGLFLFDVVENGTRFAKDVLVETAITAHRGSSTEAPENTLQSIKLAAEQMADYVEIDVQLTKDGEIILLHDKSFKRTCGEGKSPWEMTLAEIKKLNAAYYMPDYGWAEVPTLRETLEYCKDRININIELKNNGHDGQLPDKVLALVKEFGMEEQCVFTSMSIPFLERVKELDEECKTGYILSTAYGDFSRNEKVDFFSISSSLLNEKNIAQIHETGREIHAWTVNTKAEAERLKYLDVDNIITDYPVMVREILYREKDTENFLEILLMVLD